MKEPLNYLIPILFLFCGIVMGMNKFEPVYPVTEIVIASADTLRMSPSACMDMFGVFLVP